MTDPTQYPQVTSHDASKFRVSAFGVNITNVSNDDADDFRTSAFSKDGSTMNVSAKSLDASTLRVSASLYPDTTGGLTIHRSLNVSASHNVKATAGAIYGYYAYNFAPTTSYVKIYNVSGAINVGTDVPLLTIGIPASAAANMQFSNGLAGFTNGISIVAISGAPDDNTASVGASSVGMNLFYK